MRLLNDERTASKRAVATLHGAIQELRPVLTAITPAFDGWIGAVEAKIAELVGGLSGRAARDLRPWYEATFIKRLKETPELTLPKARLILDRFRRIERTTDRLTEVLSRRTENEGLLMLLRNVIFDFVTLESALLRCFPELESDEAPVRKRKPSTRARKPR